MALQQRQHWMGILARADEARLSSLLSAIADIPGYDVMRGPETGLVMVRGRAGGSGRPFNLGEMTVTRCTVRTTSGALGDAYVAGRRSEHARRAAIVDALLQDDRKRAAMMDAVITPLEREEKERRDARKRESAATRVDFFTLVRGEDE